jgi:hypothetical protein
MPFRATTLRAAAVAALAGVLAVLAVPTATAEPGNTGSSDDVNALAGSLSKGYDLTNCTAQQLTKTGELAGLLCGQSPDPNGPAAALYSLFDNGADLTSAFKSAVKTVSMAVCGDAGESPTVWRQGSSGQTAGQVACGTSNDAATIIWTTNSKNVLGTVTASNGDLNALYEWWRTRG